jgi:DNA-binding transcriptional regulator YiaG
MQLYLFGRCIQRSQEAKKRIQSALKEHKSTSARLLAAFEALHSEVSSTMNAKLMEITETEIENAREQVGLHYRCWSEVYGVCSGRVV